MANAGKFTDRSPIICAAGLRRQKELTVGDCLKVYPTDDAIVAVMNKAGLKKVQPEYKQQRMENVRHCGSFDKSKSLLYPPVETRYQTLLRDLKETVSDSYWKRDLGKMRDPIGGLPPYVNEDTTFGTPVRRDTTVKDLLNPPKTMLEIQLETAEFHPMYTKTHNDYYPGEQKDYKYNPPFNKYNTQGGTTQNYDPRGIWMKCAMTTKNVEPVAYADKVQADYLERTHFQIGKTLAPNCNIKCVPSGYRFGKLSERPLYGVADLMSPDLKPDLLRKDFFRWLSHLNELRLYCKKHNFDLKHINQRCRFNDEGFTGWIPFSLLVQLCADNHLTMDHESVIAIAQMYGFYDKNHNIKYKNFLYLLDINKEMPDLGKFEDCEQSNPCKNFQKYLTTYRSAQLDYLLQDNSKMRPAGHKASDMNIQELKSDDVDQDNAIDPLIRPCIFTNYGLSVWDFFQPREPEVLKKLFESVGYQFPDDTFEKLWSKGLDIDKTGKVCIETFRSMLHQAAPIEKKEQQIIPCNKVVGKACDPKN